MRPEKGNLMDVQRKSFIEMKVYNSDFSSADYEYSGYDTQQNDQHEALIKQYNKILSKRFPNSKSEESSMHHTPIREVIRKQNKNKYNFHIPAHLRSKSKEFLAPQNRDGWKYNLEVLSNGKYSVKENQSYTNITKRRLLQNLKGKLSPPSSRVINPRHINKAKYINKKHNLNYRSDSLSGISKDTTQAISKNPSKNQLSRISKLEHKSFGSNRDLHFNKSLDEASYGRSSINSNAKNITSRQLLQRLQKQKLSTSFNPN